MKNYGYLLIIITCFILVALLEDQKPEARQELAEDYADTLEQKRQCVDWACMGNLD